MKYSYSRKTGICSKKKGAAIPRNVNDFMLWKKRTNTRDRRADSATVTVPVPADQYIGQMNRKKYQSKKSNNINSVK